MKKFNNVLLIFITAFICIFAGCRSIPGRNAVNPLDLLDGSSSFYLRIPAETDRNLIVRMLQKNVAGISEKDASTAAERIDTIYVGLNRTRNSSEIQLAASCSVPEFAVSKIFSKKNGWTSDRLVLSDSQNKAVPYVIYSDKALSVSFPSEDIVCIGRNVPGMLETYNALAEKTDAGAVSDLDSMVYEWLSAPYSDIRFFASKPQSFLTILTGANLNFKLVYVRGIMTDDPRVSSQYIMELEFEFLDYRMLPAAKGMLSVAFGLTDSDVIEESPSHLKVSNIKISKEQLYKILIL